MARIRRGFGFRSGFEDKVQKALKEKGIPYEYETVKLEYTVPSKKHKYTPDFIFSRKDGSKLFVEAKGRFDAEDRAKMLLVREANPELDIRMLFMRDQPIRKGSPTYYSTWCIKNNFQYSIGTEIPSEWLSN